MKSRLPVKRVRDYLKSDYDKQDVCYICSNTSSLELHHAFSISELWNLWLKRNKLNDNDPEKVNEYRIKFADDCAEQLSYTYTLCKTHHLKLHSIYGPRYSNYMARNVINWINKQQEVVSAELDKTKT